MEVVFMEVVLELGYLGIVAVEDSKYCGTHLKASLACGGSDSLAVSIVHSNW